MASNEFNVKIRFETDTKETEGGLKKVNKEVVSVEKNTGTAEKEVRKLSGRFKEFSESGATQLAAMGLALNAIKQIASTTVSAFKGLGDVVSEIHARSDTLKVANIWRVQADEAKAYQSVLNDVRSSYSALVEVVELRQLGVSAKDTQSFAHLVNIIAALTGAEKDQIAQRVKNGQLLDREFRVLSKVIGKTKDRIGLTEKLLTAQYNLGHELDQGDRINQLLRYIGATKELEASLGKVGEASPFDVLWQDIKNMADSVIKSLLPALKQTAKLTIKLLSDLKDAFTWTIKLWEGAARKAAAVYLRLSGMSKEQIAQTYKQNALIAKGTELAKKHNAVINARKDALDKEKRQRDKIAAGLKLEATQELVSRAAAGRAMLRNFDQAALSSIAGQGVRGVGTIVGGLSRSVELAKVLTATLGPKFYDQSSKAWTLFKLSLEKGKGSLDKVIASEQARNESLRNQLGLVQQIKDESKLQRELINEQKTLGAALKAIDQTRGILSKSRVAREMELVKVLDKMESRLKSISVVRRQLLLNMKEVVKIQATLAREKERLDFLSKELALNEQIRQTSERIGALQGEIIRDRGEALRITAKAAKLSTQALEAEIKALAAREKLSSSKKEKSVLATRLSGMRQQVTLQKRIITLIGFEAKAKSKAAQIADLELKQSIKNTQLQQKQSMDAARRAVEIAKDTLTGQQTFSAKDNVKAVRDEIDALTLSSVNLAKKLKVMTPGNAAADAARRELDHNTNLLAVKKDLLKVSEKQLAKDKDRATTAGSLIQTLQEQGRNIQQRLGQAIAAEINGMAQGITGALGGVFEAIAQGSENAFDDFGKNILDALGTMALKFAAFFAAEALGMAFTPGGQANAVGLAAAAAGMAAVGGTLKGVAASINTSTPSGPSGTSSQSLSPASLPGGFSSPSNGSVNVMIVDGEPWDRRSPQERFSSFKKWEKRNSSLYGFAGS